MNLEEALFAYIFPYNEDDEQRTDRLISVVETLEERQKLAFIALVRKQKRFNDDLQKFRQMCEDKVKELYEYTLYLSSFEAR